MENKKWTKEQIENFFRHETMRSDDSCKKIASTLAKDGILNILIHCNPDDYTERYE